ncbi:MULTISPECIES: isopentenyl-diphosphate Delta-isomerase [Enterobacteriaceae]|uniref:isopentenyl-diphosphate Delta-isomerase n=1 Tax=Enterobacteriaceae TaxID=543 RepID=UPI000E2BC439|nr:isopentenyl-diphosphate Delta-isomerase [Klebsiella pneumoniae]EIV8403983.1 isopentenyl-diphosphate Delta-isomerase [Escherichia coli]SWE94381.1 isopentenyl-diphosphate delta-isomerase [Klebsiella pneumoniae]HBU5861943.1 isopentenyl-diphosphate Delta-isomerase [Klebsiella pneumoniae]HBU5909029.1 isopentenyl-diphosphate Delta-isomerase [Klebsiella pneumoniae]HBX9305428.1 isopentenyl-diphosphate Delta-isomerase [Klebsiella pneumoniae]
MTSSLTSFEHVVLLDAQNQPVGKLGKLAAHHAKTPRHLAFSVWLFNRGGDCLLTRRALVKKAWPGVWTNSVCGHPQWQETFAAAIRRRCRYEAGVDVEDITLIDHTFSYCETDPTGIVENEYCPVYAARVTGPLQIRESEAMAASWVTLPSLIAAADTLPALFSPWLVQQLRVRGTADRFMRYAARAQLNSPV